MNPKEICEFCNTNLADGVVEESWICIECFDRREHQFVEDMVVKN